MRTKVAILHPSEPMPAEGTSAEEGGSPVPDIRAITRIRPGFTTEAGLFLVRYREG